MSKAEELIEQVAEGIVGPMSLPDKPATPKDVEKVLKGYSVFKRLNVTWDLEVLGPKSWNLIFHGPESYDAADMFKKLTRPTSDDKTFLGLWHPQPDEGYDEEAWELYYEFPKVARASYGPRKVRRRR